MITPEILARPGTEHSHQCAVFCWASLNTTRFPVLKWMFAIPNGGERNIIVAASMKAEGVKKGVSDICLPVPMCGYHGLFIEMKKLTGGKESKEQIEFGAFLTEQGYLYRCCYGWEQAVETLEWYLAPK